MSTGESETFAREEILANDECPMAPSRRLTRPLTGAPHSKLRIGQFRLGAACDHGEQLLDIYTIERRGGAYKPGDD